MTCLTVVVRGLMRRPVRTGLTLVGISIGIAAVVALVGMASGYEKGIGKIPLSDYNWLNFFLSNQDNIDMYILGVKTATKFLIEFDWDAYKNDRTTMQVILNSNKESKESKVVSVH